MHKSSLQSQRNFIDRRLKKAKLTFINSNIFHIERESNSFIVTKQIPNQFYKQSYQTHQSTQKECARGARHETNNVSVRSKPLKKKHV